jgi:3-methyladenine DNA glycosylase AlkD
MVRAHPELLATLDRWIDADDFWLARVAILHQLRFAADTDADRLFRYSTHRAGDAEFFIRKAIGWALREYAKTAPDEVRSWVALHEVQLSGLSRREALKHLV